MKFLAVYLFLAVGFLKGDEWVVLSAVGDLPSRPEVVEGFGGEAFLEGEDRDAFSVTVDDRGMSLLFSPRRGKGVYRADLKTGEGVVRVFGLGTEKLEGSNEPGLQDIFRVLGVDLDAGGRGLHLNTREAVMGDSVAVSEFVPVEGEAVRVTGVARYSPKGETPFGFVLPDGKLVEIGVLDAETETLPDAHQRILPPVSGGQRTVTVKEVPERFGLYLEAHRYTSLTIPGASKGATIEHTARVFPVKKLMGRERRNAYLICFEEASNGDYQDAIFLLEGVKAVE
ncbi:MAG: hypothetical protein AAGC74_01805 [Verrucomicrobiota bacterium]